MATSTFDAESGGGGGARRTTKKPLSRMVSSDDTQQGRSRSPTKYDGEPLRQFKVKQYLLQQEIPQHCVTPSVQSSERRLTRESRYHLENAPAEIQLCVEEWQMVLMDPRSRLTLQTIKLRDVVCWSGTDERLNLLLATFDRVSLKVRLDESMSKDADKVRQRALQ